MILIDLFINLSSLNNGNNELVGMIEGNTTSVARLATYRLRGGAVWRLRRTPKPIKTSNSRPLSSNGRYFMGMSSNFLRTMTLTMGEPLRTRTSQTSDSSRDEKPLTITRPDRAITVAQSRVGSTDSGAILLGARNAVIGCFSRSIFPRYSITSPYRSFILLSSFFK